MLLASACLVITTISAPLFQHQITKSPFFSIRRPPPPLPDRPQYSGARTSKLLQNELALPGRQLARPIIHLQ